MKFKLFQVTIKREGHTIRGHIVAPSKDAAAVLVIEHDEALGLVHEDFLLERIDGALDQTRRLGLEDLLELGPTGFASFCDIGWIAHTAPIQKLKLFGTKDPKGFGMYAVAPNVDIAAAVFSNSLLPRAELPHHFSIYDLTASLPEEQMRNLHNLLELGPIGVAEFDAEKQLWFIL